VYRLRVPDHLVELIRGLHPEIKRKIREALRSILSDPSVGKPLKDELSGLMSLRVSRFRVIYRIVKSREIQIIGVGPRGRIYEETYRLIRKEDKSPTPRPGKKG
jgi:mRNA interferase RelE/StbE